MREILFRGKRKDNGEWIYGVPCSFIGTTGEWCDCIMEVVEGYTDVHNIYDINPETLGEYTGSVDKNGHKIYENDIVKMPKYGKGYILTKVYFKDGKFAVDGSHYYFKDLNPKSKEVVGNIYDNPELLDTIETNGYADQGGLASAT